MIATRFKKPASKGKWFCYLPWIPSAGSVLYFLIGGVWPHLSPIPIRDNIDQNLLAIGFCAAVMAFILGVFVYANLKGYRRRQLAAYLCLCGGMVLFSWLVAQFMATVASSRSARSLAQHAAPFITQNTEIAIYDTYLTGLIFYLRHDRPIWVVGSPGKTTWMGSPYVSRFFPNPAPGHGKVLVNLAELADAWNKGTPPVLVFAKAKNISRLQGQLGEKPKELLRVDEYVLMSRP
jgi:hypothetical protein